MGHRSKRAARCEGCGLHVELCLCAELPKLSTSTRLWVVRHQRERFRPTNTARLLANMVPAVEMLHFPPRQGEAFEPGGLEHADAPLYVLYPREDATPLAEVLERHGSAAGFVVLDGTWHQCSRMARRVPIVQGLPCVSLPDGPPSVWGVRTQHDARGLSTLEAAARLLRHTDGDAFADPLRDAFFRIAARGLFMKAKLRDTEVPRAWWAEDPTRSYPAPAAT